MSLDTYYHKIPETRSELFAIFYPCCFPHSSPCHMEWGTGSPWLIRYQELLSSPWKRDTPVQDRETSYLCFSRGFLTSQNNILSENKNRKIHTHKHKTALHMLYAAEFYSSNSRKSIFHFCSKQTFVWRRGTDCKLGGLEYLWWNRLLMCTDNTGSEKMSAKPSIPRSLCRQIFHFTSPKIGYEGVGSGVFSKTPNSPLYPCLVIFLCFFKITKVLKILWLRTYETYTIFKSNNRSQLGKYHEIPCSIFL